MTLTMEAARQRIEWMEKLARAVVELEAVAADMRKGGGDTWSERRLRDAAEFARDVKQVLMEEVRA